MQVVGENRERAPPAKKTVTFGSVESCDDPFESPKRSPPKSPRPLVSIIKKRSVAEPTERPFRDIVRPAKLTDLGATSRLDFGSLRAHHDGSPPAKRPAASFSRPAPDGAVSPPPGDGEGGAFALPGRVARGARSPKASKRLVDGDEAAEGESGAKAAARVLKRPKLVLGGRPETNGSEDRGEAPVDGDDPKPPPLFEKALGLFGSASTKGLSAFRDALVGPKPPPVGEDAGRERARADRPADAVSRRLPQPSRNVSETPCTSDQSSSSGASESDSDDSLGTSESDDGAAEERPPPPPPEKAPPPSQLLSGKVVLREARLQLNNNNSNNIPPPQGSEGPFSSFASSNQNNSIPPSPPCTVTCGVCGAVRFYRFARQARKFGIHSCESCRKFISKMLKRQNIAQTSPLPPLQCLNGEGNCRVPPIVRSQQWKLLRCAYKARCHACWLKMCIKAFQLPVHLKASLQTMLPAHMRPGMVKVSSSTTPTINPASTLLQLNCSSSFNSVQNSNTDSQDSSSQSSTKNLKSTSSKKVIDEKQEIIKVEAEKQKIKEEDSESNINSNRKRRHARIKVRKKDKVNIKQQFDSTKRQKVELKGPRVKHVCRSASIVLGQPLATFPSSDDKNMSDLSDDGLPPDNENSAVETIEKNENDLIDHCSNCESDRIVPDKEENATDDESISKTEEMEVVKDESSDSFDSIVLKETNKENDPTLCKPTRPNDSEKEDQDIKQQETNDAISQRKHSKLLYGNFSNIKLSSKQKYNQQRQPETICTDFWESYDPDEVCNTGWGLISSIPFTVNGICFLCGSRGKEKLIHCVGCCELYHPFCAEISDDTSRVWLCPRCVQCTGCGRNGTRPASTICRTCHRHFHADCLIANRNSKYRSDWPKICSSCLKCKSCDSFKVTKFLGNLPFCSTCFRLRQKGNYCPLCQGCYQDNDFDSKMMECGWCSRWVHARCEELSGEGYQLVSALPHSVEYICKQCLPENAPWRNMLSTYLRGKLLSVLKALAKNKNACALLKLTPHKSTPVSNKSCACSSPYAVRKLLFDENSFNSINTNVVNKNIENKILEDNKIQEIDSECSNTLENEVLSSNENNQSGKIKGTVHKLQESLLQNKEICLSMGPCLTKEAAIDQLKEKYQIKDCCVKMKDFSHSLEMQCDEESNDNHSSFYSNNTSNAKCMFSGDNFDQGNETDSCRDNGVSSIEHFKRCPCSNKDSESSPSLLGIKTRVNCNEYTSVKDFNKDMLDAISRTFSPEIKQIYKDVFTECFPWFNCELNCLNPSLEIGDDNDDDSLKDEEISTLSAKNIEKTSQKNNVVEDQTVPSLQCDFKTLRDYTYEDESLYDSRMCVLCKVIGEGNPSMEERLLYCGQGDWIHANCALWSAEVFEEIDGSLQDVQSAIARGKMIKCSKCLNKGASVGCCAKNCSETYHFTCARNVGCALLDDKTVFCPSHVGGAKDKALQKDDDFILSRPVYVELDRKKKKYSDPQNVQFLLGSLVVQKLGRIVPSVSDFEEVLIPADFLCARLYWSSKQPWKIVKYTIRTKLLLVEPSPAYDLGVNITLDHSVNPNTVDRILAEIDSWHKSLEMGGHNLINSLKDKSPMKCNVNVSLEDYAVKQVMECMLELVCRQDQNDDTPEEEPQNTADLLPPELKDAIFEDLNHDLLEGISMQDIFPKLMSYEDLVAMDMKNEVGFGTEVMKENKIVENVDENVLKPDELPLPLHEKLRKSVYLSNIANENNSNEGKNTAQDFLEDVRQNELGKEIKRNKSELIIHGANIKNITSNRNNQRACSLTWSCKIEGTLSSSIKRCKLPRPSFLARSDSGGNVVMIVDGTSDLVTNINTSKTKIEELAADAKGQWQTKTLKSDDKKVDGSNSTNSPTSFLKEVSNETGNSDEPANDKIDKSNVPTEQVIDFYTKMRCSPISQLDGADDFLYHSVTTSSQIRPKCLSYINQTLIPQLDGVDDASSSSCSESGSPPRDQNSGVFFRPNSIDNTYTMTISTANLNNIIPNDNLIRPGQIDQTVTCDRCNCTYRTKDSYNRHLASCDLMSTSESEGETPKSPESRTLTTLQNAFNGPFVAPAYLNQHNQIFEASEQFNLSKPAIIGTRRASMNTRQITINGTIVETQSPGPQSPLKLNGHDSVNSHDMNVKTSIMHETPKLALGQGILSQPQIMVTNLPVSPPRNQTPNGSKCGINQNQTTMPYSICVKPNTGIHTIQPSNQTITHMLPGSGNIQTVFSNPNQVLTISSPQQNILQNIQNKTPIVQTFANLPNGQTLTVPVNSLQGLSSPNNNLNAFVRPSLPLPNTSTILMSNANVPRITSPNIQQKNQILLPQMGQKSPKKLQQVQPKPIFQATRGRGRAVSKAPNNKRQNKQEKTITSINPATLGSNAVIQFQPNGPSNQPSIILQQVPNPNMMSYVETLQQQHGPNMQYIATIAPQGDFKPAPTHYISQGGILPQTFQIQQTESGGLVAVPSGGIPVFLPQGGVGILPQASLQSQGMAISSQGNIQNQGVTPILSQGAIQTQNGTTIMPQATIQTQNGTTLIPQGATIQSIPQGNIQQQNPTLLPANNIQSQGATIVPHNNINGSQNILPQAQNNTIISQQPNATIIPQGAILPQGLQFCNDQVLLGSTPTLEMVTDSSGCMYLTTQPVYYGLETIVQNTVMSSQQFVSTAMQGVLAQNSSFSATTTQVFQASKIEPIVEMPAGYVVVNNVPQDNIIVSQSNPVNSQTLISTQSLPNNNINVQPSTSIQVQKSNKNMHGPNITIQPAIDKQNISSIHRSVSKALPIQPNQPIFSLASPHQVGNTISLQALQPRNIAVSQGKQNISLQPMPTNIIQSNNVAIPINTSQQCNVSSDNMHVHINQPIISNPSIGNNASKIQSSMTQYTNQGNIQDNMMNCHEPANTNLNPPTNGQQMLRPNFSQQCWRPNQSFVQTSSESNMKNQNITIQPNEIQMIPQKNIPNVNNVSISNISLNAINSSRNYTSPFNQTIYSEASLHLKNNSSLSNANNMSSNVTSITHSVPSHGNSLMHNNTFPVSMPTTLTTGSPYIISGSLNQQVQPVNNGINILSSSNSHHNSNPMKESSDMNSLQLTNPSSVCDNSNMISKQTNLHQIPCNIHRPSSVSMAENSSGNNGNLIHLPNNSMMNLSIQGGKVFQIPMPSNSIPHVVVNNSPTSVPNQINCNLQMNSSNLNQNNGNMSNNQMNISHEQIINSNNFHLSNGNINQSNCVNNNQLNSNLCNQHQINAPSSQHQIINVTNNQHQIQNHQQNDNHQMVGNHSNHQANSNTIQIGNCNSNNHIQLLNANNQQMQISNGNMNVNNNINMHGNVCGNNNRSSINNEHLSIVNNSNHIEINRMMNDTHMNNSNDRNHMQINMNCVNRMPNNMMINQMQSNTNSNQNLIENAPHCDISSSNNNVTQYQASGDKIFLVNNTNAQMNANNNVHNFQNSMNQLQTNSNENQIQQNSIDHNNVVQHVNNQCNVKMLQKHDIYGNTKVNSSTNNSNVGLTLLQTETDAAKMNINKQSNPILSISAGNQIGYIQMNPTNQILNFNEHNRIPLPNNLNSQMQNQRNQNAPILTIGQNDVITPQNANMDMQSKISDMPSLNVPMVNNTTMNNSISSNSVNKPIHLPQHNISNNCLNSPMNFTVPNMQGFSNIQLHNNNNSNMNHIPAQNMNNTISLPVQNTSSITLPKAPSHQSGIPTNVVNPIPQYMRPMNRVLPIHRDAQSTKTPNRATKTKVETPKQSPRCQDMPDLNSKEEEVVNSDIEKAIRESKKTMELEEQKKNQSLTLTSNLTPENTPPTVNVDDGNKQTDLKTPSSVYKIIIQNNVSTESETKPLVKTLKENVSSNLMKPPMLKPDPAKLTKENTLNISTSLKSQNLISQRKIQVRNKVGSENIPNIKMTKQPPSGGRLPKDDGPKMIYEITSEDGFSYTSSSLSDLWNKLLDAVQAARKQHGLPLVNFNLAQSTSSAHILGLHNNALKYLVEQLPGASRCMKYRAKHGCKVQTGWDSDIGIFESFRESPWGTARAGPAIRKSSSDMFSWLASPYRDPPPPLTISPDDNVISRRLTSTTLPMAMRFRHLKETSKHTVGVYRSHIHGRGLFCKRDIEAGEMVIEYAGEVIRAALADQRERRYEAARGGRGVTGCYMFRVDDHLVVDATMKGNAARFINHSCDPNCYSKVVDILGHKHILILALRRICQGEELTYDYKFPFEEVKIPCSCGAKRCRKYLN